MKKRLGPSERLFPMPCPLIVSGTLEKANLFAAAWINVVSSTPPTVALGVRKTRHTLEYINRTGDFSVNVAPTRLATQVDYCGLATGRNEDKWAASGLHMQDADSITSPLVAECPYNLECTIRERIEVGDYVVILAEIVESHADESVLSEDGKTVDIEALDPLVYIAGSRQYRGLGPKVADAFKVGKSLKEARVEATAEALAASEPEYADMESAAEPTEDQPDTDRAAEPESDVEPESDIEPESDAESEEL
jgi:flavin reductase (DIM6/NTAB) family NADH-FMN oxidoreductase RutF